MKSASRPPSFLPPLPPPLYTPQSVLKMPREWSFPRVLLQMTSFPAEQPAVSSPVTQSKSQDGPTAPSAPPAFPSDLTSCCLQQPHSAPTPAHPGPELLPWTSLLCSSPNLSTFSVAGLKCPLSLT